MSSRLHRSWSVLASYQTFEGDRCVDLFRRPDATIGYEEFRRDPEDMGAWTAVGYFSNLEFASEDAAVTAARRTVPWLDSVLER